MEEKKWGKKLMGRVANRQTNFQTSDHVESASVVKELLPFNTCGRPLCLLRISLFLSLSCSLFRVLATVRRRGCSPCIQKRESKRTRDRTYNACHGGSGGEGVEDRGEGGWVVCGVDETKRKVYMTRER